MHQLQRIGLLGITVLLLAGFWVGLWYQGQRKGGVTVFAADESESSVERQEGGFSDAGMQTEIYKTEQIISAELTGGNDHQEEPLAVHVVGSVASPGLYFLPPGSRIYDAVMEAEPEEAADLAKINMAMPVEDGMQIRVPMIGKASPWGGEALVVKAGDNRSDNADMSGVSTASGKININTASAKELETLPGIGPAFSQRIIQYREKNGGFHTVDELMKVKGIGTAKMSELRDLVCCT